MKFDNIPFGKYQHYKTQKTYEVIGVALHSETHEEMIIYKSLYVDEKFGENQIWVRPSKMFFEEINSQGKLIPRFKYIEE